MTNLEKLQEVLKVHFNNAGLLEQALTHSSYINENAGVGSNERLEFLGDAVLGLVVARELYEKYPDLAEGDLTKLRASLVRRDALSRMALSINLGEFLCLGKGEESSGGREKPLNLASALEAVIGAIFLDLGLEPAQTVITSIIEPEMKQVFVRPDNVDYKSLLQEMVQSRHHITPSYKLLDASGLDHSRIFTVQAQAGETVLGTGSGSSKKIAEMDAARASIEKLTGKTNGAV